MPGISVITNFDINGDFPLDHRLVTTNSTMRDSITYKYEGMMVYVQQDKKTYTWNGSTWTQNSNGIYGGSGSLVGNTVVDTSEIGTYSGSQSYTLSFSSQTDVSGSTIDSTSIFRRFSVGSNIEFIRNFSQKTGLGSITNLSSQAFVFTGQNDVNFKIGNFIRFGLTSSGIILYNQNFGTYSASITFTESFGTNATYSLPPISGTFAMTNQLSMNTSGLQQITTIGNTTSRSISINVIGASSDATKSINLRPVGNSITNNSFTTFWYSNYSGPGSYLGIKSSGNSIVISTPGGDGGSMEMRRLIRMFSGSASNYTTANINATNGFFFSWRPFGSSADNSLYLGSVTISSNREIYFPNRSGIVSLGTTTHRFFKATNDGMMDWIKTYTTTSNPILFAGSNGNSNTSNYSGTAGGYVQITRESTVPQYIQLPSPVGRTGDIINFLSYNWNPLSAPAQFDTSPIYMTGSSGFSITGGLAFWDYQIGPTGGYTNSWYGGRAGSLISDGTKWIKWNYDYTRVDFQNSPPANFEILSETKVRGKSPFSTTGFSRTTIGKKSDKWYWETRINLENSSSNNNPKVGISLGGDGIPSGLPTPSSTLGSAAYSVGVIGGSTRAGVYKLNTSGSENDITSSSTSPVVTPPPSSLTPLSPGEVLGHALDLDSTPKTYTVYRGGTDPANVYFKINISGGTIPSAYYWYPSLCSDGTTNSVEGNFGQFGFSYSVPTGFNRGIFFKGWDDSNIVKTNQGIGW